MVVVCFVLLAAHPNPRVLIAHDSKDSWGSAANAASGYYLVWTAGTGDLKRWLLWRVNGKPLGNPWDHQSSNPNHQLEGSCPSLFVFTNLGRLKPFQNFTPLRNLQLDLTELVGQQVGHRAIRRCWQSIGKTHSWDLHTFLGPAFHPPRGSVGIF